MPRVGEGWIGETQLFYALKAALPSHDVRQHARPRWLGRQHLDIFIPSLGVAVEYQGAQHDQPIAYFGGEKAFYDCKQRDERKRRLCQKNNVRLVYVREGYLIEDLLKAVLPDGA